MDFIGGERLRREGNRFWALRANLLHGALVGVLIFDFLLCEIKNSDGFLFVAVHGIISDSRGRNLTIQKFRTGFILIESIGLQICISLDTVNTQFILRSPPLLLRSNSSIVELNLISKDSWYPTDFNDQL